MQKSSSYIVQYADIISFSEFFTEIYVVEHTLYLGRRSLFFYFSWNSKMNTKKRVDRYYVRGTIGSHLISRQVSHSLIGPKFANVPRSSSPNSSAISRMLWLIPRARKKLAGARLLVAQWNGAFTEIVISRGKGPLSETSVSNLSTFSRCPRRVLVACHSLCRLDSQASQRAKQKTRNKKKKKIGKKRREKRKREDTIRERVNETQSERRREEDEEGPEERVD